LVLAVFTAPFISILDRGNLIGFLPGLFYLALVLPPTRKVIIGILLGIVSAIKVYPLMFLLFLPKSTRLKTGSIAFMTFISLNLFSAFVWGNPITIARKILNAQKDFSSLNITGDSMNFSSSSIALNVANFILGSNSKMSQLIQYNSAIIGVFTLLLLLVTAHFGYRAKNPITYPFLGLYALQLIPIISYTYTRWWGIVILGLLLNQTFMGRERDEKYEIFIWITVLMNSSLLNFNEFHPISIFPTISFVGVVAFCVKDVLTNLKFRQKSS
jgi:hypothetical protein